MVIVKLDFDHKVIFFVPSTPIVAVSYSYLQAARDAPALISSGHSNFV